LPFAKFGIFKIKLISIDIRPLYSIFKVTQFNSITETYQRPTLVAMVMKIWEF